MVYDDTKHCFRNLRLNTGCLPDEAAISDAFTSVPRTDSPRHQSTTPHSDHGAYTSHVSSELSSDDLLGTLPESEDTNAELYQHLLDVNSLDNARQIDSKISSSPDSTEPSGRERGTSVSFNSHAMLDDGMRHSLNEPLPKPGYSKRRTQAMSITGSYQADRNASESPRINPFTGEPVRRRTRRSDLSTRSDRVDQDQDANHDTVPPLTSGSLGSPYTEAIGTPMSTSMTGSMLLSPQAVASPSQSPSLSSDPWTLSGREGTKSRITSRHSSLRNVTRQSRGMSATSPASAFLSMWGKESLASIAPDPDDEGQMVGLNGEYIIGRQLGYGGFSVVKELHGMSGNGERTHRAVKIVRKTISNLSDSENDRQQQSIEHEVATWRYLQHEYILPLHSVYDTDFATFCVMDLVEGGTLFELVRKTRNAQTKGLQPLLAKHYAFQLASALRYLHQDIRMVHRDVKLENCLLDLTGKDTETNGGTLKLCDFGLAEFVSGGIFDSIESLDLNESDTKYTTGIVGTLQYAAPESFATKRQISQPSIDVWAFGICVYAMITGDLPFKHSMQPKVIEMITSGNWNREAIRSVVASETESENIMDLLDGCLETDPSMRWNITDVMASSWFEDMHGVAVEDDWQMFSRP